MLSARNAVHFVFGSFIFFSLEDEAKYLHSNKRMTDEKCVRVYSGLVYMLDGVGHT